MGRRRSQGSPVYIERNWSTQYDPLLTSQVGVGCAGKVIFVPFYNGAEHHVNTINMGTGMGLKSMIGTMVAVWLIVVGAAGGDEWDEADMDRLASGDDEQIKAVVGAMGARFDQAQYVLMQGLFNGEVYRWDGREEQAGLVIVGEEETNTVIDEKIFALENDNAEDIDLDVGHTIGLAREFAYDTCELCHLLSGSFLRPEPLGRSGHLPHTRRGPCHGK